MEYRLCLSEIGRSKLIIIETIRTLWSLHKQNKELKSALPSRSDGTHQSQGYATELVDDGMACLMISIDEINSSNGREEMVFASTTTISSKKE